MSNDLHRTGMILVVSGPSGSGKSSIGAELMKKYPALGFSVSCTTRAPRGTEKNGVEYYFLTRDEFIKKIENNEFLEYAEVHGNFYGTLKSEVTKRILSGIDVMLDIDVQGAMKVKALCAEDPVFARAAEFVFVMPPNLEVLEKRLRGRKTDAEDVILRRLENAKRELLFRSEYSYLIINDEFEKAAGDFEALYRALTLAVKRLPEEDLKHV